MVTLQQKASSGPLTQLFRLRTLSCSGGALVRTDVDWMDANASDKFQAAFAAPLSASKYKAFKALFPDGVDPELCDDDLVGLELEAIR